MKRLLNISLAIAICSTIGLSLPFDWITLTSAAGKFSILMPGPTAPQDQVGRTEASKLGPYTTHIFVQRSESGVFLAGWVDYAPGANINRQAEIAANRDNFIKSLKATLKSTREITFQGQSAVEFTGDVNGRAIRSRVYMIGQRPYIIAAVTDAGIDDSQNVSRFLDSFKLIK
jgi:hypothetical protein